MSETHAPPSPPSEVPASVAIQKAPQREIPGFVSFIPAFDDAPVAEGPALINPNDFVEENTLPPADLHEKKPIAIGNASELIYQKSRDIAKQQVEEDLTEAKGVAKFLGGIKKAASERVVAKNIRAVWNEDRSAASGIQEDHTYSQKKQASMDVTKQRLEEKGQTAQAIYSEAQQTLEELAAAHVANIAVAGVTVESANSPLQVRLLNEVVGPLASIKAEGFPVDQAVIHGQVEQFIERHSHVKVGFGQEARIQKEIRQQIKSVFGSEAKGIATDALVEFVDDIALDIRCNNIGNKGIEDYIQLRAQEWQIILVSPEARTAGGAAHITHGDIISRKIGALFHAEDAAETAVAAVGGVLVGGVARTAARLSGNAVIPVVGGAISGAAVGGAIAGIKGGERLRHTAAQVQSTYISAESISTEAIAAKRQEIIEQYKNLRVGPVHVGEFLSKHPGLIDYMGGFTILDLQLIVMQTGDNVSAQQRAAAFHKIDWADSTSREKALALFSDTQERRKLSEEFRDKNVELLPQESGKEATRMIAEMIAFKQAMLDHGITEEAIREAQKAFGEGQGVTLRKSVKARVEAVDDFIREKVKKQVIAGAVAGLMGAGIGLEAHALVGDLAKVAADTWQHVAPAVQARIDQAGGAILSHVSETAHVAVRPPSHPTIAILSQQHVLYTSHIENNSTTVPHGTPEHFVDIHGSTRGTVELVREPDGTIMLQQNGIGDPAHYPARNWLLRLDPHNPHRYLFYRSDVENNPNPVTYMDSVTHKKTVVSVAVDQLPPLQNGSSSVITEHSPFAAVAHHLDSAVTVDTGQKFSIPELDRIISIDTTRYPGAQIHLGHPDGNGIIPLRIDYQGQHMTGYIRQSGNDMLLYNSLNQPVATLSSDHFIPIQVDEFAHNLVQTDTRILPGAPLYEATGNLRHDAMAISFDPTTEHTIADHLLATHEQGAWQLTVSPNEHIYIHTDPSHPLLFTHGMVAIDTPHGTQLISGQQAQALVRTYGYRYVGIAQNGSVQTLTSEQTWPNPLSRVNDVDDSAYRFVLNSHTATMLQEHTIVSPGRHIQPSEPGHVTPGATPTPEPSQTPEPRHVTPGTTPTPEPSPTQLNHSTPTPHNTPVVKHGPRVGGQTSGDFKNQRLASSSNFLEDNKVSLIVGGGIITLGGGALIGRRAYDRYQRNHRVLPQGLRNRSNMAPTLPNINTQPLPIGLPLDKLEVYIKGLPVPTEPADSPDVRSAITDFQNQYKVLEEQIAQSATPIRNIFSTVTSNIDDFTGRTGIDILAIPGINTAIRLLLNPHGDPQLSMCLTEVTILEDIYRQDIDLTDILLSSSEYRSCITFLAEASRNNSRSDLENALENRRLAEIIQGMVAKKVIDDWVVGHPVQPVAAPTPPPSSPPGPPAPRGGPNNPGASPNVLNNRNKPTNPNQIAPDTLMSELGLLLDPQDRLAQELTTMMNHVARISGYSPQDIIENMHKQQPSTTSPESILNSLQKTYLFLELRNVPGGPQGNARLQEVINRLTTLRNLTGEEMDVIIPQMQINGRYPDVSILLDQLDQRIAAHTTLPQPPAPAQPVSSPSTTPARPLVDVLPDPRLTNPRENVSARPGPIPPEDFNALSIQRPLTTLDAFDPRERYGINFIPGVYGVATTIDGGTIGYISDVGQRRKRDEDALLVRRDGVFAVADGTGGHDAGEKASELATEIFSKRFDEHIRLGESIPEALKAAILDANATILAYPGNTGMGTTFATAVMSKDIVHIANVGDSGVYIVGNGRIRKITQDHSLKERKRRELLSSGMSSIEAEFQVASIRPNKIYNALGVSNVQVDIFSEQVKDGEFVLVCCDGLNGVLSEKEILDIVDSNASVEEKVKRLVYEVNKEGGGPDNTSVILVSPQPTLTT